MIEPTKPPLNAQAISTLFDLQRWHDVITHSAPLLPMAQDADLHVLAIHAHWALDDYDAALALIAQGRSRWPAETRFNYYAALTYLSLELVKKAESEVDAALQLNPQWAQLHALKARTLYAQQDFPKALAANGTALALAPNEAVHHFFQAVILWDSGDTVAARASLARALELDPNNSGYLAMQATFSSNKSRVLASDLLRRSLAIDPLSTSQQKSLRALTTLWAMDVALAVFGVLLTAAVPLLPLAPGQGWFIVLVNLIIGVRLTAPARTRLLVAFCLLNVVVLASDNKTGLPALWREQGPSALWSLETLAFVFGTCVMGLLVGVGILLVKQVVWVSAVRTYTVLQEAWLAGRASRLGSYVLDLLLRRSVQFNLAVAMVTMLCVVPPINVAMSMLLLVFVLPIGVWALGLWLLPAGGRPLPSVVFMLLGFVLMLATFLYSTSAFYKAHGVWAQLLWTLGVGFYALCVAHNLRQSS